MESQDEISKLVEKVRMQIQEKAGDISSGYGSMPVKEFIDCVLEPLAKQILFNNNLAIIDMDGNSTLEGRKLKVVIPLEEME